MFPKLQMKILTQVVQQHNLADVDLQLVVLSRFLSAESTSLTFFVFSLLTRESFVIEDLRREIWSS